MQKYFIINRTVTGIVTINKEALDFGKKGFAIAEKEETFKAAQLLHTLGYKPLTEEEFKEDEPELYAVYEQLLNSDDHKIAEAKKMLEDSEQHLKELESTFTVESTAAIVAGQNALIEAINTGNIEAIETAANGLKDAWANAEQKNEEPSAPEPGIQESTQAENEEPSSPETQERPENPESGIQESSEVENEDGTKENLEPAKEEEPQEPESPSSAESQGELSPKERSAKLRSAKQRLNSAKKRWDSVPEENTEQRESIEKEIHEIEEEIKSLQ